MMSFSQRLLKQPAAAGSPAHWLNRLLHYQPSLLLYLQDLLDMVTAYIPMIVAAPIIDTPSLGPMGLSLEGTVMFADIDGFSPLAERFSQVASQEGAEELTELVDRFLEILIRVTAQYGGDLLKFGGDAGMLLFQGEQHALRAVTASLEVQAVMKAQMGEVDTSLGRFPLRIATGLGSGRMIGLGMGDQAGHELLPLGPPLASMGHAQAIAPPMETVIDTNTLHACGTSIDSVALGDGMHQVVGLRTTPSAHGMLSLPLPPQLEDDERLVWFLSRLDALTPYLAPELLQRLVSVQTLERVSSEHRWVTIMMLAVEDLADVMPFWGDHERLQQALDGPNATFMQIRDVVYRYDGVLNKIAIAPSGPYIMVLFGAPTAHEDDPLRAVLAALELQDVFGGTLRIGINTGYVFAGDVGTARRREYTVMGDEVNFAARLMAACGPGEIWLGPNTSGHADVARRVVGELGSPTKFKGKSELLSPFIARGLRRVFLGAASAEVTMVGRDEELGQLTRALDEVRVSQTRAALVHGNAGVGKSRLVQALIDQAEERGFAVHLGTVPSYAEHLPFAGWDAVLTSFFRLDAHAPEARQDVFVEVLARYEMEPWAALLAPLVGLSLPPSSDVLALAPNMRDMQRQSTLLALWQQAAREQPCLIVLENVHWMSRAALEMMDVLLATPDSAPLMVVVTYRDEPAVAGRWPVGESVVDLPLGPLPASSMQALVQRLFEDMPLPPEVIRWVVARSSGLPMFATEAVRALINSGVLRRRDDSWELSGSLADFPLPDMVFGLIQSRIDQLSPPNRHLLRAAAAVGDEMTVPTLVAAYGEENETAVRRRIPQLGPFGLISRDIAGEMLTFRQPLVREVAYRGLSHRVQRLIHLRLTEYLDYHRERAAPNWLTLMAYHAFEAHAWEQATAVNLELGKQAVRSYLAEQARQALERVLEAANAGGLAVPEARFEAHHLLGDTLTSFGLYDEALAHLNDARRMLPEGLTDQAGLDSADLDLPDFDPADIARLADLDYHEAMVLEAQGLYAEALVVVERGLALSGVGRMLEGARLYLIGADLYRRQREYDKARSWATRAVALAARFRTQEGQQVRSRATYMVALLASLQRFKRG